MSGDRPESARERWNDIKRLVFWAAVIVTILAAATFVLISIL
jgi:hypothetical protein